MSTIAVGDIHGNLAALDDLLAKILPTLELGDTLVFLGDYIDRGPNTRGCVEKIIRLQKEADFGVVSGRMVAVPFESRQRSVEWSD